MGKTTTKICRVGVCRRKAATGGYCAAHYQRKLAGRSLDTPIRPRTHQTARPDGIGPREWALTCLKKASADANGPLSVNGYSSWATEHGGAHVSSVLGLFGTWSAACEAAKIEHRKPSAKRTYERRYSVEDCDAYLRTFLSTNERTSYAAFEQWAKEHEGPSPKTIRNRGAERGMTWSMLVEALS